MFCQFSVKGKNSRGKLYSELKHHKSGLMSHLLTSKWHTRPQAMAFKYGSALVNVCVCSQAAIQKNLLKAFRTVLLFIWAVIYSAVVSVCVSERTDSGHYWTRNEHTLSQRKASWLQVYTANATCFLYWWLRSFHPHKCGCWFYGKDWWALDMQCLSDWRCHSLTSEMHYIHLLV